MLGEPAFPEDHRETDLGAVAAVSDRGKRHADNQDAYAIELAGDRVIVAVCDGVSTSWRPDLASATAAQTAIASLRPFIEAEDWPDTDTLITAITAAAGKAEAAVRAIVTPDGATTATTMVLAAIGPGAGAAGSLGDTRAYWIDAGAAANQIVTIDDSWAEQAIREGLTPQQAYASPHAHVITKCLRSDSEGVTAPNVSVLEISGPGLLIVCTDGMWNYAEQPDDLAARTASSPDDAPIDIARRLVGVALDAGGGDNITVAVIPAGPGGVLATDVKPAT
jgi:serine/threonine protein phosphatase PrpC